MSENTMKIIVIGAVSTFIGTWVYNKYAVKTASAV